MLVPTVITTSGRGERSMDLFSSLLAENIICISGVIDDVIANLVIAQILYLESEDPDRIISLYINSPGGSVTAALAIYDTMQYVAPDVSTICIGQAASTSALLVAAGAKGKRFMLPNARMLITQPSLEQISGQASDIDIQAREILRLRFILTEVLARHTGQSLERIESDIERDLILSAQQAFDYGLVDVIQRARVESDVSEIETATAHSPVTVAG